MSSNVFSPSQLDVDWVKAALRELFPEPTSVECTITTLEMPRLADEEMNAVKHATHVRKREFAAGRSAARGALHRLGCLKPIVPVFPDRSPNWPLGFVGSIAHASGLAVAVAARVEDILAVGVDIEVASAVTVELWSEILLPSEMAFLTSLPDGDRLRYATVFFAIKEAFYKFQYPRTRKWMDFHDLEVRLDLEKQSGYMVADYPIDIGQKNGATDSFLGYFRENNSWVLTAVSCVASS